MRRFSGLRLQVAYPGTLGITTDKGQQNNYPLVLDAPTESYEIMLLRWQTGVYEVDAPPPTESEGMIQGIPVIVVLTGGIPVTQLNAPGEPVNPGAPVATVSTNGYGLKITLVDDGGIPMNLFNLDGTPYEGGGLPAPPFGSQYILGYDGAYVTGADGSYILGAA